MNGGKMRGFLAAVLVVFCGSAWATGWHHPPIKPPVVVKPPVVIPKPPIVVQPPVVTPPIVNPPMVTPTPPATVAPPAQPAQQPAVSGGRSSWFAKGGWAFIGVGIYFTAVIWERVVFCAQREEEWHRDNKVARCYNPQRDGMPE